MHQKIGDRDRHEDVHQQVHEKGGQEDGAALHELEPAVTGLQVGVGELQAQRLGAGRVTTKEISEVCKVI